jgi:hypothetical protein
VDRTWNAWRGLFSEHCCGIEFLKRKVGDYISLHFYSSFYLHFPLILLFAETMTDGFEDWKAYYYNPSMAAAVIFIILFVALSALHTYHLFRTRTWFFLPLVLGGYC